MTSMRKVLLNTLILILFSIYYYSFAETTQGERGLWVVRHEITTPESIDSLLAIALHYQFTDLFIQVRGRGDAYYNSTYEPKAEELETGFDPLDYLIQKNQGNNLRIHAWINVFYLWSSESPPKAENHLVNQRPGWIAYPVNIPPDSSLFERRSNSEGLFNSPLLPEVQNHVLNILTDILSHYKIDGIHLDYIRFPGSNFDFHPWVRHQFRKLYILDPLEFENDKENFILKYGNAGYELYYNRWTRFLRNGLSDFVRTLSQTVRKKNPGIIISAAVKADLSTAHLSYYQEWDRWLKEGWIDWAVPMNYTDNNLTFLTRIRSMLNSGLMNKLWIGISLYNQSEFAVLEKIRAVQELSLNGFVLFSYKQFKPNKKLQRLYIQEVSTNQE